MDHRISKDMISSGMIPSGEKNQEDLSRTQYGSAPSPNALADAYKSMYDKKEEVINEHHKKDADGNTIPHDDDVKEAKVDDTKIFNVAGDRNVRRFGKEGQFNPDGSGPRGQDTSEKAKLAVKRGEEHKARRGVKTGSVGSPIGTTEEVDLFDVLSNKLIEEGYSKKESYKIMANLTEEQLEEINEAIISGTLATLGAIGTKLAAGTAAAGKAGLAAAKLGATKLASAGGKVMSAAKSGISKIGTGIKNIVKPNPKITSSGGNVVQGSDSGQNKVVDFLKREGGQELKRQALKDRDVVGTNKTATASAAKENSDLFDIVKGQLLDEGLSEEEIKDIMLTLTPDEIMEELSDTVKRNDALNKERAMKAAQERKEKSTPPKEVTDASRRQYKAGSPGAEPYTTQDKKTIINYHKDKGSM